MSSEIKTINIKGKAYVEVAERVRMVHDQKRAFELVESEPYTLGDRTLWRVAILVDEKKYRGNAEVKLGAKSGPDSTNPFECAETSALGRALAFAGLGSVESIASFDEVARAIISQGQNEQTPRPQPAPRPIQNAPANTSKSQQNGASVAVVPTDNTQQGYLLPAEIEQLKKDWVEVCSIKEADIPKRWTGFKAYIADGAVVPDTKLTREHKKVIEAYLEPRRKKAS